ncbi:MAG: UPF0058 family protein [Methanomicrobiales archaeon]|jgi:hypothetical protein|nr:UPF0058 family protein [Methanomicrobiales archaeon]
MHKEELISLHQMLYDIKDFFSCNNPALKFSDYHALKIHPTQLHRSKLEHKYAIFVLGNELAMVMREKELAASGRISARMRQLADRTLREMEYIQ